MSPDLQLASDPHVPLHAFGSPFVGGLVGFGVLVGPPPIGGVVGVAVGPGVAVGAMVMVTPGRGVDVAVGLGVAVGRGVFVGLGVLVGGVEQVSSAMNPRLEQLGSLMSNCHFEQILPKPSVLVSPGWRVTVTVLSWQMPDLSPFSQQSRS